MDRLPVLLVTTDGEPLRVVTLGPKSARLLGLGSVSVTYQQRTAGRVVDKLWPTRRFYLRRSSVVIPEPITGRPVDLVMVHLTDPLSERLVRDYHDRRTKAMSTDHLMAAEEMVAALEGLADD